MNFGKVLLIGGALVGGYKAYEWYQALASLATGLKIAVSPTNLKASISTVAIDALVEISNPISSSITIKYPTIRASYEGTEIGSSDPVDKLVTIAANAKTSFPLTIYVSTIGAAPAVLSIASKAIGILGKREAIKLQLTVFTGVSHLLGSIEIKKDINLEYLKPKA